MTAEADPSLPGTATAAGRVPVSTVPFLSGSAGMVENEAGRCISIHSARTTPARRESHEAHVTPTVTIAAKTTAQLVARLERLKGAAREAERAHLDQERLLFARMEAALERPLVRLDSVGAIFVAAEALLDEGRP